MLALAAAIALLDLNLALCFVCVFAAIATSAYYEVATQTILRHFQSRSQIKLEVYGTVLVDMDSGKPVDLLADRQAETVAAVGAGDTGDEQRHAHGCNRCPWPTATSAHPPRSGTATGRTRPGSSPGCR